MRKIDEKWLKEEYSEKQRSMANIARELICSPQTVEARLRLYNIFIRSQGATRKIDLVGQKFGKLEVIKQVKNNGHSATKWQCKCECGKIVDVVSTSLRKGFTKSCRCDQVRKLWKGFEGISGSYWSKIIR